MEEIFPVVINYVIRYIVIEAFIPIHAERPHLVLSMSDLSNIYATRPLMLVAGKKREVNSS